MYGLFRPDREFSGIFQGLGDLVQIGWGVQGRMASLYVLACPPTLTGVDHQQTFPTSMGALLTPI
jgi:hypothetical protein